MSGGRRTRTREGICNERAGYPKVSLIDPGHKITTRRDDQADSPNPEKTGESNN